MNIIKNMNVDFDFMKLAQDGDVNIADKNFSSWEDLKKIIFENLGDRGPPPGNWERFAYHDNNNINIKESLVNYVLY